MATIPPTDWTYPTDFLASYQPPEAVGSPHGSVEARFDLAIRLMGATDPPESIVDLAECLTCPRGAA